MKEYRSTKQVNFRWWRDDGKDIEKDSIQDLKEHAEERIEDMAQQGYTSGELVLELGEEEIGFSGWWSVTDE